MKFLFKAKGPDGTLKKGTIDAANNDAAVELLQKNGLTPIEVKSEEEGAGLSAKIEEMTTRVNIKDLLVFFREFSTLTSAKVPISTALETIYEQTNSEALRPVIKQVSADIEDGLPISEAFEKHPKVFSDLAINMIRSGELSGNLEGAINYVAKTTEQNYILTSKVRGALMYPAFVITVAGAIGFIVVSFILPRLTGVIRDLGIDVPWYTNIMIKLGDFMNTYWWAVLVVFFVCIGAFVYYLHTEDGKREWDEVKLKLPIVGELFRYVYLTRFTENLSVLVAGGIPIVRSLQIIAEVVNNATYKKIILKSAEDVKVGGEIHTEFFKHPEIPPMVARMIKVGEETGRLSDILEDLAKFYRGEVDQMTRNMSSLIEPVLIVILGAGVGVLVVSVLLPIYNIAGQL